MASVAVPRWRWHRPGPRASACRIGPASPIWHCSAPPTIPRPGCPPWPRHPPCRRVHRHPPITCGAAADALLWGDRAESQKIWHCPLLACHWQHLPSARACTTATSTNPNRSAVPDPRALARSLARTGRAQSTSAMTTCVPNSAPCCYAVCLMSAASMLRQIPDLLVGESISRNAEAATCSGTVSRTFRNGDAEWGGAGRGGGESLWRRGTGWQRRQPGPAGARPGAPEAAGAPLFRPLRTSDTTCWPSGPQARFQCVCVPNTGGVGALQGAETNCVNPMRHPQAASKDPVTAACVVGNPMAQIETSVTTVATLGDRWPRPPTKQPLHAGRLQGP